jgi:hypothetical protein
VLGAPTTTPPNIEIISVFLPATSECITIRISICITEIFVRNLQGEGYCESRWRLSPQASIMTGRLAGTLGGPPSRPADILTKNGSPSQNTSPSTSKTA